MSLRGCRDAPLFLFDGYLITLLENMEMDRINKELRFKDNPRVISPAQLERLSEHLDELGDLSGVVYCRRNKAYAGGNQRPKKL